MAPTICSDKTKPQNLRANHKELRRHRQISRHLSLAHAAPQASSIISYVSNGTVNIFTTGLRLRSDQSNSNSSSDRLEDSSHQNENKVKTYPNISFTPKNVIHSQQHPRQSTLLTENPTFTRSTSPLSDTNSLQYSSDDDILDDDEQKIYPYDSKALNDDDNSSSIFSSVISSDMHSQDESSFKQTVLQMPTDKKDVLKNLQQTKDSKSFEKEDSTEYRNGLLSIALKTIKLVQRNQLLQQRLAQLQIETTEFIESVMSNPENQHFRQKVHQTQQQKS